MTGEAIGEIFAFGVGVALSPLAIVAVVLLLVTPGGSRAAWAFVVSWVLSLVVVSTVVVLVADEADASEAGTAATWVSVLKIALGAALLWFGASQLDAGDASEQKDGAAWLAKLHGLTPGRAASLGVLLAAVKPKNLLLTVGAGLALAQIGASSGDQAIALVVFVSLGSAGLAIPVGVRVLMGNRGLDMLTAVREWMVAENATIIAVLCFAFAAKLIGDAIISLAG